MKRKGSAKVRSAALVAAALLLIIAAHTPAAQSFCNSVIPSGNLFGQIGSLNVILGTTLLIMLLMASISGILYAVGYSFRLNGLLRVSKQELGEIAITTAIVFVLVGTFVVTTQTTFPTTLLANSGAYSRGIFASDCNQLTGYALILFQYSFDIGINSDFTQLVQNIAVSVQPLNFGVSFSPLAGYATSVQALSLLFMFSGAMGGLLLAIGIILGIFYMIMPLFLFAGIILRTLPWTRAAGGAFLGIFIGFFIVFPLLLHFIVFSAPANLGPETVGVLSTGSFTDIFNLLNPGATFSIGSSLLSIIDPQAMVSVIVSVLVPALYAVFAFLLSFIISFDFAEVAGDFLGAPSLSTSRSLNKLL